MLTKNNSYISINNNEYIKNIKIYGLCLFKIYLATHIDVCVSLYLKSSIRVYSRANTFAHLRPVRRPRAGEGRNFLKTFWGVYWKKNEGGGGGGRDPIHRGGETPKNGEKVPFFWENFRAGGGGGGRGAPFAPSLRTGLHLNLGIQNFI